MSNKGRGRGVWGRISQVESRPGSGDRNNDRTSENQNTSKKVEIHNNSKNQFHDYWDDKPLDGHEVLIELMEKLNIDKPDAGNGQIIKRITKTVYDLCISPDSLSAMINKLHDKSLDDKEFGRKSACVLGSVSQLEVGGVKLRDVLLRTIQTDFKKREEMRSKHPQILYNAVRLLCEVFKEVKLGDGSVISVLCVPILEYFQMLLDISSPASIQLLGQQLRVLGQDLQVAQGDRVVQLMMKVRRGLVEGRKMGEGEKSVLMHLMELYLLRWPVLLPQNVEDWYETHREAFDCLVVVMDGETVTPIYSEKDWMGSAGGGGKGRKEEAKVVAGEVNVEQEKAISSMLREARISGDKEVKEESEVVKKRNKIAAKGGLWGRALQDLEAADKSDKDREEKATQGVESKRQDRAGSVGDIQTRVKGNLRGVRAGSVGQTENRSSGQASRNGRGANDERKDNLSKRVSPIPGLPVPACKEQSRWHDDRTNGHDERNNGHDNRTNGHDNRSNGHDNRTNGHDNRTNGHDNRTNGHHNRTNSQDNRINGHNNRTNGHDDRNNGHKDSESRRDNSNMNENDLRNTMGKGEEGKGIKDRLGKVEKNNGRNGENKENSGGGDLRGRLNRMKTSPAAAGDWTGVGRQVTKGLVVNVSLESKNGEIHTPEISPRDIPLSPPTPDTPDWKNEAPLEGNWADDLDEDWY